MASRFRRLLALLMLLCMPFQALSALDAALCLEQGYGDSGSALATDTDGASADHDRMDFGGLSFDSCALCHLGCAPLVIGLSFDSRFELKQAFVAGLDAACIEHDPYRLKRPPRLPLA